MAEKEIEVVDIIDSDEDDVDDNSASSNKERRCDNESESVFVSVKPELEEGDEIPVYDIDDNKVFEMPTLKVEETEGETIEKNVEETKDESFNSDPGRLVIDEGAIKTEVVSTKPIGDDSIDDLADLIIIESDEEMEGQTAELQQVCEEQREGSRHFCAQSRDVNGTEQKERAERGEEEELEIREEQAEECHATREEQQDKNLEETAQMEHSEKELGEEKERRRREREEREQREQALREKREHEEKQQEERALREQKEKELKVQRERAEKEEQENNQREQRRKEQRKLEFSMEKGFTEDKEAEELQQRQFSTQDRDEQLKQLVGDQCMRKLKRSRELQDTSELQLKQQKEREMSEKLAKRMSEIRHQFREQPQEQSEEPQVLEGRENPRASEPRGRVLVERVKKENKEDQEKKKKKLHKVGEKKQAKVLLEKELRRDSVSQNEPEKQTSGGPIKLVRCLLCESFFTSISHLHNHMASVHGPRNKSKTSQAKSSELKAEVDLGATFAKSNNQYGVINLEDDSSTEVSVQAPPKKASSIKRKLKENRAYSSPRSLLQCRTCSEVFSSLHHLRQHRTMKHRAETSAKDVILLPDNQRDISTSLKKCPYCPYTTSRKALLHRHVKHLHLGARESVCKICGKDMNGSLALKMHYQTEHADKLTEKCPYCPYKSRFKSHIKLHINASHRELVDRKSDKANAICQQRKVNANPHQAVKKV